MGADFVKIYRLNRYFVGFVDTSVKTAFDERDWDLFEQWTNSMLDEEIYNDYLKSTDNETLEF